MTLQLAPALKMIEQDIKTKQQPRGFWGLFLCKISHPSHAHHVSFSTNKHRFKYQFNSHKHLAVSYHLMMGQYSCSTQTLGFGWVEEKKWMNPALMDNINFNASKKSPWLASYRYWLWPWHRCSLADKNSSHISQTFPKRVRCFTHRFS